MSLSLVLTRDQIIDMLTESSCEVVYDTAFSSDDSGVYSLNEEDLPEMTEAEILYKGRSEGTSWENETQDNRDNNVITGITAYDIVNKHWATFNCSRLKTINGTPITYSN
jgi:hypothetical protein